MNSPTNGHSRPAPSRLRKALPAAILVLAALILPAATAAEDAGPTRAAFNFKEAPPDVVLDVLAELFAVQFVSEVPLEKRLSLNSGEEVGVEQMVTLLDRALRRQGAAARLEGDLVRIVPVSLAVSRTELVRLQHADPTVVAQMVTELFKSRDLLEAATQENAELVSKLLEQLDKEDLTLLSGKLRVVAVPYPRLNAVVLKAPEASIGAIKQFISSELDKPGPPPPPQPEPQPKPEPPPLQTATFKVQHVEPQYVADMAKRLFGVDPIVEPRNKMLILRTRDAGQIEDLKTTLELVDTPPPSKPKPKPQPEPEPEPPVETKLFKVQHVPLRYVAEKAKTLYGIDPLVDERTGTLILRTNDAEQVAKLQEVLEIFDTPREQADGTPQARVFSVEHAPLDYLASMARSLYGINPITDERTRTLILRSDDPEQAAQLREVLQLFDRPREDAEQLDESEVFKVEHVPATHVASMSQTLYGFRPYVEDRSNSLILRMPSREQVQQLEEVLAIVDVPEAVNEQTYHVKLNNSTARDIKRLLDQLYRNTLRLPASAAALEELDAEQRRRRIDAAQDLLTAAGMNAQAAQDFVTANLGQPVGEVNIVEDSEKNALLIRTHPRNIEPILRLIETLDTPSRQVFIKVFIAEVTLDDTLEMGIDFIYTDVNTRRSGAKETSVYTMDFETRADAAAGTAGLNYSFISNNVNAFFRLLQATTRLDVISTPHILTLDNSAAEIEFGRRVPLLQTTQITDSGVTNSTVRYEDVTTRLRVTPYINPAGFIRMTIDQHIDDVSSDTFAITENLAPRILITRRAKTSVRVRDGQTVCLGGFVGDTIDENEEKVPILGDIPGIGSAFRKTKNRRVKTELLIFITPYILDTPQELLEMTNEQREASIVARRDGQISQELQQRPVPRRNPFRDWGRTRSSYTIPERSIESPAAPSQPSSPTEPTEPTEPTDEQAPQPPAEEPVSSEAA